MGDPRTSGRSSLYLGQQRSPAASRVTEKTFLGERCSPFDREGSRKGGLNIASTYIWPARRGWQIIHQRGRNKAEKTKNFLIGAWNVRTLMDRDNAPRPQRRTALVAKELLRYNIDTAGLSETRLAEKGSITELASGYTFFWKGKGQQEDRIHGVSLAIRTKLMKQLPDLPVGRYLDRRRPVPHLQAHLRVGLRSPESHACPSTKVAHHVFLGSRETTMIPKTKMYFFLLSSNQIIPTIYPPLFSFLLT